MTKSSAQASTAAKFSGQNLLLAAVLAASAAFIGYLLFFYQVADPQVNAADTRSRFTLQQIPFNGQQAYDYLKEICAMGPRISGTPSMLDQQQMLTKHFEGLGGKVRLQSFMARNPLTGSPVPMSNLIVEWHPERKDRILLAAHYDTRPFPDQDHRNPRGTFVGANDGASGVALLMELGKSMPKLKGKLGVDFVLFDGEELVINDNDPYFLGSEYFANQYAHVKPRDYRYRSAVLVDMIGDADLQIFQERNSMSWADSRGIATDIWNTAKRLGVREFVASKKYEIKDDHLMLHNKAEIPTIDIIDFDYPHWHTEADIPANCSALSLAKVGWVLEEWLKKAVQ